MNNMNIISIQDGDSITIASDELSHLPRRFRLADIDAPEKGEPYYRDSINALRSMMRYEGLRIELTSRYGERPDCFGRVIGYLHNDECLVNLKMIELGMAACWWPKGPSQYSQQMLEAQESARREVRGIWNQRMHRLCNIRPGDLHRHHPRLA